MSNWLLPSSFVILCALMTLTSIGILLVYSVALLWYSIKTVVVASSMGIRRKSTNVDVGM